MLEKELFAILPKIINDLEILEVRITDAKDHILYEYDKKTLDVIDKDYPNEFDIQILEHLGHYQLQKLDKILEVYPQIEMETNEDGIRIFSRKKEVS